MLGRPVSLLPTPAEELTLRSSVDTLVMISILQSVRDVLATLQASTERHRRNALLGGGDVATPPRGRRRTTRCGRAASSSSPIASSTAAGTSTSAVVIPSGTWDSEPAAPPAPHDLSTTRKARCVPPAAAARAA